MEISIAIFSVVLLILTSAGHYGAFLEDVCEKDDVECQHPNDSTVSGHLQHGKSSQKNVIRRIRNISLLQCIKECFLTSACTAINYRKNWKLCDAVADKINNDRDLIHEDGCIFSKISTWYKSFAGVCAYHNCATGKKCVKNRDSKRGFTCISASLYPPRDCADIPRRTGSSVYKIHPMPSIKFDVYCEMDTEEGGWTVIQRRLDGSTNFYRGWTAYEEGFGNLTHNFWLGHAKIHKIVSTGNYHLRVELEDFEGNTAWAKYTRFYIGDVSTNYKLEVSGYVGTSTAGDSFTYHNGKMFSTYDRDNDIHHKNCAVMFKGAWWYHDCHNSNLNGAYLSGIISSYADGVIWYKWKGHYYSLKSTILMIKKL
ncbi:Fibrinogen-like protein A,Ryncolin-4,Angiopoietin-related protein 7,Angiopoietin-related protein 1,Ficolin-3,Ficolin-1-B,Techylectin-5A,Ficolin-2,Ryncolin-1,Tenascin-R,Fibrinogen-like protein 1,Angiopoietin-1,Fibrinogen C domain-containing protein 1-A,Ryncolin-3,Tenascin,Techylectin-like protein,Fibrinogen C domain-containing protein 1,Fibrinogen gamma chain,Ryncolin-2,Angiopoietin-related protein 6,Techylectin-5B,Angiopoietin-related protein 2,Angiopoietin-2,Microfibril-associated glycoprotein 4,Ficolin-1|uniref:Fibrinogen C-terminal domain-containing protein n=1 Tax=Mytilus coruscus TaxID=42192 RepID=A0A6J8DA74_MYTCO|nr:Fibrinogen-like protein A,Ryncolin-4,Angiopoietin-related protein 7,Angiopoietin-related protein 1,Ficolin-3,Ficolin-1-B,Techylectin-5A,Ficolin-2,Ryncolin-1,Tenascin-R,Fibrinogen-like protein 1,Angiopoietin-1,Fibrinogen C domain-containing protein 1-A,Ryncolin-3,Tenascin,Techylectin-like protein,Fibrinogen C domain-containing protein 1,Fibrinogen gamma chain,Ryncolin-2,Angiopoietin-related protein 6,Techylectin-5B,Angiopoietin-related protein 2,Angiopoietin-2,Microfibril-associated glycoprotein 